MTEQAIQSANPVATKPGYKHTPLGWIPEDWEIKRLDEFAPLQRGFDLPVENISEGKYPVVFSNGILKYHDEYKAKAPGVVTGRSGTIGAVTYVEENYWPHNTSLWVTNFYANFPKYVYYFYIFLDFKKYGSGSGVPTLNRNDLHTRKIAIPPLPEQKAVAAVLSTWDKAIATTTRLIEQKQQRKKWLMQQLLTGKKRLKGFSGEWREVRLGDVFERVTRKLQEDIEVESYTISSKQGFVTQHQKFNRVIAGSSLSNYTLIKMDEFSYNKGNSLTYPFGCIFKFEAERGLIPFVYISFRARKSINPNFFKFYFEYGILERQLKMIISSGARGDGLLNVAPEDFFKLYIKEPSIEEQTAVAAVLQAADKEIQLLHNQLQQLKEQKKGLMQQLLTGKKRIKI